jgi:antitoxin component of MazEF toxin-antitoxin module
MTPDKGKLVLIGYQAYEHKDPSLIVYWDYAKGEFTFCSTDRTHTFSEFDRIVLFDFNRGGTVDVPMSSKCELDEKPPAEGRDQATPKIVLEKPTTLLMLDCVPVSDTNIDVSDDQVIFTAVIRSLLKGVTSSPQIKLRFILKMRASGGNPFLAIDQLMVDGERLPDPPMRLEELKGKKVILKKLRGAPIIAERLGLKPQHPPGSGDADLREQLKVEFIPYDHFVEGPVDTPFLLSLERFVGLEEKDQQLISPFPGSRMNACGRPDSAEPDSVIAICKEQVRRLRLDDRAKPKVLVVQRQPINRETQDRRKYERVRPGQWTLKVAGIPDGSVLRLWNDAIARPYMDALHTVQDGRPVSAIPYWTSTDNWHSTPGTGWALFMNMLDRFLTDDSLEADDISLNSEECSESFVCVNARSLQVESLGDANILSASMPGFLKHDGKHLDLKFKLIGPQFKERERESETRPIVFELVHLAGEEAGQLSRVGALDLEFPSPPLGPIPKPPPPGQSSDEDLPRTSIAVCFRKNSQADALASPLLTVDVKAKLLLQDIRAGGQDDIPGEEFVPSGATSGCDKPADEARAESEESEEELEARFRRQQPVIIPFPRSLVSALRPEQSGASTGSAPTTPRFELHIEEHTAASRSHTFVMRLVKDQKAGGKETDQGQRLIVLDAQPFMIALVEAPPFATKANAEGINEVGNWSASGDQGAGWELIGSTEGFDMQLPPQAVGEAMEKWKLDAALLDYEDIIKGQAVDFRFSPAARLKLLPSFFKQRFGEAPWNLRRILGFPGQRAPGAGVVALRFELLYGLTCKVDYPFLRLAELDSKLGRIPGRLEKELVWGGTRAQKDVYKNFRKQWSKTYERYFSRLSVLEPYDTNQPGGLTLQDGLAYELRKSAKLKYPISPKRVPKDDPRRTAEPHAKNGLAGGVSWGFESANVYDSLLRAPQSSSGKLANPYFSALGGWGYQKASFNKDLTTIYSNTAMGRVFYYSLERIGRIGVFWNLAKHVIVYERTAVRSPRFSEQEELLGQAVIRKVDEYVEVLQPSRKFPEFGAAPVTRGFVAGCEFKSRIIHVKSDWGNDVRDEGWQVPLWKRNLAQSEPETPNVEGLYPKPHVVLEVAASGESGSPTVFVEIEEPEKLVFFTRTTADADTRTDLWPAVREVDFPDLPKPEAPDIKSFDDANLDRPLADAAAIEPGFGRFTYAVAPASRPVNLVVERAEDALSTVIRNVTMARSKAKEVVSGTKDTLAKLSSLGDKVDNNLQSLLSRLPPQGNVSGKVIKELRAAIGEIARDKGLLDDLEDINKEAGKFFRLPDKLCKELGLTTDHALDSAKQRVTDLITRLKNDLRKAIEELQIQLKGTLPADLKQRVLDLVEAAFRPFDEAIAPINSGLDEIRAAVEAGFEAALQFEKRLNAQVDEMIRDAKAPIADHGLRLREQLHAFRDRLLADLRELESRAAGLSQGRLGNLAEQVRQDVRELINALNTSFKDVDGAVESGSAAVVERLAALRAAVKAKLARLDAHLTDARQKATGGINDIQTVINDNLGRIKTRARDDLETAIKNAFPSEGDLPRDILSKVQAVVEKEADTLITKFNAKVEEVKQTVRVKACGTFNEFFLNEADAFARRLKNFIGVPGSPEHFLKELEEKLRTNAADFLDKPYWKLRQEIEKVGDEARHRIAPYVERVKEGLAGAVAGNVFQNPDNTLRLLRAFGDAPKVPNLEFNRKKIAYFFDEAKKAIDTTPVTALVNRAGNELKALGIRVPTSQMLDRFIPDKLHHFNVSDIFPDFAGLKLGSLFSGLRMPSLSNNNVKVTQGIDKQTLRAWLQAAVQVPVDEPATIFSFGPVTLRLLRARFDARAMITIEAGRPPKRKVEGVITGDWELQVGSLVLVTFRGTSLMFDENGKIRFSLSPRNVEMNGVMKFISDLISSLGYSDNGFSIRPLVINSIPVGVESVLDLPLPGVQLGAFGITGLRLGSSFRVLAMVGQNGVYFTLGLSLSLGQKVSPFTLTIFILTGGGWLEARATYAPLTKRISTSITVGMVAGALLAFELGPIKGAVSILFGISAEFHSESGAGGSLAITLMLLIRGEVQVLGFISISLIILLEAEYQGNGSLVGRGSVEIRVKICWCFTLSFSASVEYRFAEGASGNQQAIPESAESNMVGNRMRDSFDTAAGEYVGMLE